MERTGAGKEGNDHRINPFGEGIHAAFPERRKGLDSIARGDGKARPSVFEDAGARGEEFVAQRGREGKAGEVRVRDEGVQGRGRLAQQAGKQGGEHDEILLGRIWGRKENQEGLGENESAPTQTNQNRITTTRKRLVLESIRIKTESKTTHLDSPKTRPRLKKKNLRITPPNHVGKIEASA
jgi:hypothetical protein